ncbi:MAG: hypothetical protein D6820_15050 [Lentisphaerae bacterium]|nr:MAG: hypothetical protein D6820_15050 [Lentisphaerota bacterium]
MSDEAYRILCEKLKSQPPEVIRWLNENLDHINRLCTEKEELREQVYGKSVDAGKLEKILVVHHVRSVLSGLSASRLAVFGAGKHTRWLESICVGLPLKVVAVLDDHPRAELSFWGLTPRSSQDFQPEEADYIILSSDCFQKEMARRCRELYGDGINLIDLYFGLRGPFEKSI